MREDFYDEYFDLETYHWWFRGRQKILPALLSRHVTTPAAILDVGSGGGAVAASLLQFGTVVATDPEAGCAAAVEHHPGLTFQQGTAEHLPFANATFYLVTAF